MRRTVPLFPQKVLSNLLPLAACILLSLLWSVPGFALDPNRTLTQYVHRIWQLPQGLPDATITSILQTHDGYLWLGTETGLVRFDGVRFFRPDDSTQRPSNHLWIRHILEDDRGLWIGTNDAGLFRLVDGNATQYTLSEESPHATVQCLVSDGDEALWACTSNGLVRWDKGKLSTYGTAQGLPTNNIRAACKDNEGKLWVGGDGNQLSLWTGSEFVSYPLESLPAYGSVRALQCSGAVIWIGSSEGLIRKEANKERLLTVSDGLADNWIYCLLEGRDGTLWIGTKNGFSRLRNDKFDSYRTDDGLSQSTVYSLYEDHEGNLWVGTKHGLNQFLDGRTIPYTVSEGLPTNNVGPVIQDRKGIVWIGTIGSGLCRFEDGHFRTFTKGQGLAGNEVYALAVDDDGSLWVGTNGGLNHLKDGHVDRTYTTNQGLPENRVEFLSRDKSGVLWIGTATGMAMLQNGELIRPKESIETSHPILLGGGEDGDGHFLEATETGLKIYSNRGFADLATDETPLREVDTFYVDREGLLWLGTLGSGLRMLRGGKVASYFMRDGLFDNEIYGIASDSQDRLWLASSKGIFSVKRSDLLKYANGEIQKLVSTPYSPLDGLRTIECKSGVQPAVWTMDDGTLWFSTIRGLLVIDPRKLARRALAPPVVIEDVSVNGQPEDPAEIESLAPGRKDLEFRYTALSFFAPGAVNFRYILEGYDTNWTDAATRRVAYYTNLPPGKFRFRVLACEANGTCGENGSSVAFTLASHYYQRPWLLVLCAVFLTIGVWVIWQQRVRMLKQQFEIVLGERGRIARELHDTLLQGFSGITMGMQAVSTGLPELEARHKLDELIHDAAHCLKQARQSIAGLRGETGVHSDLDAAITKVARESAKGKGVELVLNLERSPSNLAAKVNYNILRIAQEAIANAIQHADATRIEVSLTFRGGSGRLSVADDGKGLTDLDGSIRPGHYGLTGMKERASEIGADFQLVTGPVRGTTISVVWKNDNGAGR